jgi:predicted enzyme related to lactoylglutathione lyase
MALDNSVKRVNQDNYRPQYVTQAFKAIRGQIRKSQDHAQERAVRISNGFEPGIDLMTLVQLPAARLEHTVAFYVEVLGLSLSHPDRPIEHNCFVQTTPKIGPGLHIIHTPNSEFRHLHGEVNGRLEEFLAFYSRNLLQLYERLMDAGAQIVEKPSIGYMSFLDPEGHLIGVYERTDADSPAGFESNITGIRHVQMRTADPMRLAAFFEQALGFRSVPLDETICMAVQSDAPNQPMIRFVQASEPLDAHPMHWLLDGRPKHALELHSPNIETLRELVLENGGNVQEELEYNGCGGYLKFYTPDGHYIWVNQDRRYCDY